MADPKAARENLGKTGANAVRKIQLAAIAEKTRALYELLRK
jgi:hypothetical protein